MVTNEWAWQTPKCSEGKRFLQTPLITDFRHSNVKFLGLKANPRGPWSKRRLSLIVYQIWDRLRGWYGLYEDDVVIQMSPNVLNMSLLSLLRIVPYCTTGTSKGRFAETPEQYGKFYLIGMDLWYSSAEHTRYEIRNTYKSYPGILSMPVYNSLH